MRHGVVVVVMCGGDIVRRSLSVIKISPVKCFTFSLLVHNLDMYSLRDSDVTFFHHFTGMLLLLLKHLPTLC